MKANPLQLTFIFNQRNSINVWSFSGFWTIKFTTHFCVPCLHLCSIASNFHSLFRCLSFTNISLTTWIQQPPTFHFPSDNLSLPSLGIMYYSVKTFRHQSTFWHFLKLYTLYVPSTLSYRSLICLNKLFLEVFTNFFT